LLDENTQIPGILVLEQKKLIGLIPREKVYEKLGRPYGVELYLKSSIKQFYEMLEISSLVLYSDTIIADAVKMALMRGEQALYEPMVVAHPNGQRVISMYSLLIAQQDILQNLYSEVHYLSTIDPLTVVNNRRGFFEAVNQRLVTIRHFDLEYAVLMIDIDNFKNVNDRYGHVVGDEVIKSVAQRIYSQIREKDVLRMLYLRDFETEAYTLRVASLALNLAQKVGVSDSEFEGIRIGALLHDVGKIAIPDEILFKQGKLTTAEWAIMQKHPQYAHDLIAPISYFQQALDIPYCHHEHWSGGGYPRGLRAQEIPLAARIFTIVDVWDALSSDRPYRAAWTQAAVKEFLELQAGVLFDPDLVPLFFESLDRHLQIGMMD
jgi:HD-GYP domain-containing protein (c-di-GMP phosphodiesterase class II)